MNVLPSESQGKFTNFQHMGTGVRPFACTRGKTTLIKSYIILILNKKRVFFCVFFKKDFVFSRRRIIDICKR